MQLPILLSVPHAGWRIPEEVKDICLLSQKDIVEDGDVGADEIYYPLQKEVAVFITTDIGRAIVDLNRAEDDFRKDGVIKTHTCWDVPVYKTTPGTATVKELLKKYYHPYHNQIGQQIKQVRLGIDAHTMAAFGPPVGPDSGKERPSVCISNAGLTCPQTWLESLGSCLEDHLNLSVSLNTPFKGGYIIRSHSNEIPWIQIEYSRAPFLNNARKTEALFKALIDWCRSNLYL
jgi:N-formylglutamate amidohydrolase